MYKKLVTDPIGSWILGPRQPLIVISGRSYQVPVVEDALLFHYSMVIPVVWAAFHDFSSTEY